MKQEVRQKDNKIKALRNTTGGGQLPSDCPQLSELDKQILALLTSAEPLSAKKEKINSEPHCFSKDIKIQPSMTPKTGDKLVELVQRKEVRQTHLTSLKCLCLLKQLKDPSLQDIENTHRRIVLSTGQVLLQSAEEYKENFPPLMLNSNSIQNTILTPSPFPEQSQFHTTPLEDILQESGSLFNQIYPEFSQRHNSTFNSQN